MDLTCSKYDVQKAGEQITVYPIPEINKNIKLLQIHIEMGLSESSLKVLFGLSHI